MFRVRAALVGDAQGMSSVLHEIVMSWESDRASSQEFVLDFYIRHCDQIACVVALDADDGVVGFQSLKLAVEGNPYGVAVGWGVIGTYVRLGTGRRGIGRALFAATLRAARDAGISTIDATIGEENGPALAYYEAIGFRTYRSQPGAVCKRLFVQASGRKE